MIKGFIEKNKTKNQGLWVHIYVCVLFYYIILPNFDWSSNEYLSLSYNWWFCTICMIVYECKQVIVGVVKHNKFSTFVVEVYGCFWNWFNDSFGDVLIPASLIIFSEILK